MNSVGSADDSLIVPRLPRPSSRATEALQAAGLGLVVFILAGLSLNIASDTGRVAAIWPANAAALIVLLRVDVRRWPMLTAAAMLGNLFADLLSGDRLAVGLSLSLCDALEALACAAGLRHFLGRSIDLSRKRDMLFLAAIAGVLAPFATALLASAALSLLNGSFNVSTLVVWAAADGLGMVILTPAFLVLTPTSMKRLFAPPVARRNLLLLAAQTLLVVAVFGQNRYSVPGLAGLGLLAITFQMELAGAALSMLVTAPIIAGLTFAGRGPFGTMPGSITHHVIMLQLSLAAGVFGALAIGGTLAHRRQLQDSLAGSLADARMAEARVLEAQRRANLAEEIAGVGYWRMDARTRAITWSEQMFKCYGLPPGPTPDFGLAMSLIHPDDIERTSNLLNRALEDGLDYADEVRVRQPGGDWRNLICRAVCERGARGEIAAVFGTVLDITDLRATDEALRASEARFRLLAENANDLIVHTNMHGNLTYVSSSCLNVLGYRPEEVVGLDSLHLVFPEEREAVRAAFQVALYSHDDAPERRVEYRMRHKDGSERWVEARPTLLTDAATGKACGIADVVRDVTARRQMEADLRRERAAAEAAALAKSEFLANMSHEIRTPLTSIIGFSGLLRETGDLPASAQRYAQRISTAGQALLAVVNDVLDFSKLEAGQVELDPHPFSPAAYIEEMVEMVGVQAANKNLTLTTVIDPAIPAMVIADSSRLRQVVLNLIGNAIKFTAEGGVTIKISHRAEDSRLEVSLIDTGPGIPAERRDRLFQRFSQVDGSVSRQHGGTGLGLAICKSLVELMGGEIGVDSVEGQGSTFWFNIHAPVTASRTTTDSLPVEDGEIAPARILVVDDVSVNRELVRAMLTPFGHSFEEAENGAEAVEAAMCAPFDLILMDLQMPGMDGFEAARTIRATANANRDTPIVALSANVLPAHLAACLAAGMDDHMAKPINPLTLLEKVAEWSCRRRAPFISAPAAAG